MPDPDPVQPTVAQLQAEIAVLKSKIAAMVPSEERDALKKDLEAARAELAELKKPADAPAPPDKSGFKFPKLF
jgi:hypothetical protein